jgi:hypothetical protein
MNIASTVWTIVAPVLVALAVAAIAAWGNAMVYAAQMIYQAYLNTSLLTGADKMAWVVAQVKAYMPSMISAILGDSRLQSACQSVYDAVKSYAMAYFDDKLKLTKPEESVEDTPLDAGGGNKNV